MTPPSWSDLVRVFGRIGLLSFGGPAAQIALMHRELVEERLWLSERDFLGALSFCMLLPGPEAMQLATYAGWRLRGWAGGLLAGLLFVLPGAAVIAALVAAYVAWGDLPLVAAAFLGIKAAVVVIVVQALIRLWRKSMTGPVAAAIAGAAFVAIYALALPFPLILAAAALVGYLAFRTAPAETLPPPAPGAARASLTAALVWGALWAAPLAVLAATGAGFLLDLGLFFSKLAVVTFGGAYAVLAWLAQAVVQDLGWIAPDEMIDALGLAETTPGPLILVTQFVAMLAGHHAGGPGLALAAGAVALWTTFVPCFLWIFAGAPWIATLSARPGPAAALRGITAAVTGVIANLSLWFALHVWFGTVTVAQLGPLRPATPVWSSLSPLALALTAIAAALLLWRGWGMLRTLAALALLGIAAGLLPPILP